MDLEKKANELICQAGRIAVACHLSPDGDTLGAGLALWHGLRALGKEAKVFCDDPVPKQYGFLPGQEEVSVYRGDWVPELFITVDAADAFRTGAIEPYLIQAIPCINIDHHASNPLYGTVNIVEGGASSTCQVMAAFLESIGVATNHAIATCLYVGLLTDTDRFSYASTTPETLRVAATLLGYGVDVATITQTIYRTNRLSHLRLLAEAIRGLALFDEDSIGVSAIPRSVFTACGAEKEDMEGIIYHILTVETLKIAVVMKETADGGQWKVSFRSKGQVAIDQVASAFGGGGHRNAAGCMVQGDLSQARQAILDMIREKATR